MATKVSPRSAPSIAVVAPSHLRELVPPGGLEGVDWRWVDSEPPGRPTPNEPSEPLAEICICVNQETVDARARLGFMTLSSDLRISEDAATAGEIVVACTAEWAIDGATPVLVDAVTAPVYAADRWRQIADRGGELALHLLRRVIARAPGEVASLQPTDALPRLRPLRPAEMRRWRLTHVTRRLAHLMRPRALAKRCLSLAALLLVRPARDTVRSLRRRHPVRVFTFHRVTDLCRDSLTVSNRVFRRQLRYIGRHHRVIDLDEALRLLARGERLGRPHAVITFDDAYACVHDFAAPVMRELGVPGCCFAPTEYVGSAERFPWDRNDPVRPLHAIMSWDELGELRRHGWTIGGHTATHARLAACDADATRRELEAPLEALRRRLGVERPAMAYPFGGRDDLGEPARKQIEALGYAACLSNHGGENFPPTPAHALRRIDIGGDFGTLTWMARIHGIEPGSRPWSLLRPGSRG